MNSTVPTAKAELKALFAAAVEAETEVWPSRPAEDHQLAENVYVEGARGRREFASFPATGPKSRRESYQVACCVEVWRAGYSSESLEETEARLWVIVGQVETAIATNPPFASLESWGLSAEFRQETPQTVLDGETGYLAKYDFGVEVTARI